jgi:PIN domain nuclease of toxin-antitoxin system
MPIEDVRETLASFSLDVIPFTQDLALVSAMLAALAREHDLSLGDRAAIATAYRLELPVLTADHDWHNAAAALTEIFGTDPGLIFIR